MELGRQLITMYVHLPISLICNIVRHVHLIVNVVPSMDVILVLMDILCTMVLVYNVLNLQVYMEPVRHVAQKHKVLNLVVLIVQ